MTPEDFKSRIVNKAPDAVANDGRRYADIPAYELTKMIVDKAPNGVTNDGIPYKSFLPAVYEPQNKDEQDYLKQAASIYDKFAMQPTAKAMDATHTFLTEIVPNKTLSALSTSIYANTKGIRREQEKQTQELAFVMDRVREKMHDPETPVETKKRLADIANISTQPQIIESMISGLDSRKVVLGGMQDIFDTMLLAMSPGGLASAISSGAGKKQVAKEAAKTFGKFAGTEAASTAFETKADGASLTESLSTSFKSGSTLGAMAVGIESALPAGRLVGRLFSSALQKVTNRGGNVAKLEADLARVAQEVTAAAPDNLAVGKEVTRTLGIREQAANEAARNNIRNTAELLEQQFVNKKLDPRIYNTRFQTKIDDWKTNEKEIADIFWGQEFLATTKGTPLKTADTITAIKNRFENTAGWESFKQKINSFSRLFGETGIGDDLRKALASNEDNARLLNQVSQKLGGGTSPTFTVDELILTERGIRDLIGAGTKEGFTAQSKFYAEISSALKDDIFSILKQTDPAKAQAYADEVARYAEFRTRLKDVAELEWSKDPMGSVLKMTQKEVDTLYNLSSFKDDIAETQEALVNYMVETSKENGVLNVAKLEEFINKAAKNGSVSKQDLADLVEYKDLHVLVQGTGRNATDEQAARMRQLLGSEYESLRTAGSEQGTASLATRSALGTGNIDELMVTADKVVDRIIKLDSAGEFKNIWDTLTPELQQMVSRRAVANAYSDAVFTSSGINYEKLASYLNSVGVGSGNKSEIVNTLFNETERIAFAEIYKISQQVADGGKSTRKIQQLVHLMLGLGYISSGAKTAAANHLSYAARLAHRGEKAVMTPDEIIETLTNISPNPEVVVSQQFKIAEPTLLDLLSQNLTKGAVRIYESDELLVGAEEMLGRKLSEEERAALEE